MNKFRALVAVMVDALEEPIAKIGVVDPVLAISKSELAMMMLGLKVSVPLDVSPMNALVVPAGLLIVPPVLSMVIGPVPVFIQEPALPKPLITCPMVIGPVKVSV